VTNRRFQLGTLTKKWRRNSCFHGEGVQLQVKSDMIGEIEEFLG
jgi:hypothetical protein